jgi:hypothetical protein
MRAAGPLLVAFAVVSALGACGDRYDAPFAPHRLAPDPNAARDGRFLKWGATVTIGGISRSVLSAAIPNMPPTEVLREGRQPVALGPIPAEFRPIPWLIIESVTTVDGVTKPMATWPASSALAGKSFRVPIVEEVVGVGGKVSVVLWPVPDLATRDVETGDVTVPARALLLLGGGLEPACLQSSVVPLDMKVTALAGGRETVLHTFRLEPRRDANRWVDVQIPLDQLGGQVVRFRFTARPILGPTAVPTLPVWAEPTIVDARTLAR